MTDFNNAVSAIEKRNGLRIGQYKHTWFITQNNPAGQIPECAGKSPEDIVQWAITHCVRNSKGELLKSRGVGVCYERGNEEHTDHIHIVLSFTGRNGGKAETVYRLWPKADIEVAQGAVTDLYDYLYKRGRFEGKGETIVEPSFDGDPLMANSREGGKVVSDPTELSKRDMRWMELRQAIEDGMTEEEIWTDSALSMYAKDFVIPMERLLAVRAARKPRKRSVTVIWVTGEQRPEARPVPIEVMESVVRDWLDGTGLSWGEWDMSLSVQPHVSADTEAILVVIPGWGSSADSQTVYRIMSGSPCRVAQGYGRGFWAAWNTVVVVCGQDPLDDMSRLVTRLLKMPLDASMKRMREIVSADDTTPMGCDEICALFDATVDMQTGEDE